MIEIGVGIGVAVGMGMLVGDGKEVGVNGRFVEETAVLVAVGTGKLVGETVRSPEGAGAVLIAKIGVGAGAGSTT